MAGTRTIFAAGQSATGDPVQNMAAMANVGTLFAIINLTSTATASVRWRLYRSAASGKKEDRVEVLSHLALDVMNRPNAFYSLQKLVEVGQQHIDLTGECWLVIETNRMMPGVPTGIWPVRPDRITPVPSETKFLAGYVYTSPDGEKIPLDVDQVMPIQMPNPLDPYRGMGPVQSILANAQSMKAAIDWNRNFFTNGAEPGGIVETPASLADPQFRQFQQRWAEQHRGVSNAHRVALLEGGAKWVDRKYSHTDMAFGELYLLSRDALREAFAIHPHMLGDSDDVNLANATAAEVTFARRQTVARLDRWRGMWNNQFLPKFGATAVGLEFDYDSPVAEDQAQDSENFLNRARGSQFLVSSGFDGALVAAAAGLPDMGWKSDMVVHGNTTAAGLRNAPEWQDQSGWDDNGGGQQNALPQRRIRNADPQPQPDDVDLTPVQEAWVYALNTLLARWAVDVTAAQIRDLAEQIVRIIDTQGVAGLASLTVDPAEGAAILKVAMQGLADLAGRHVVQEAARQGHTIEAATAEAGQLDDWASMSSNLIALGLQIAAAREAMRVAAPDMTGTQVADEVKQYLSALSDASVRGQLGAALTAAQNAGRFATMRQGPEAALYADERMDKNTCEPCRQVNGRWLGNVSDMAQVERTYPSSGYVDCIGAMHGNSCRGTVVAIWRPKTTADGGDE